jgi:hypothetical protein
MVNWLGWGSLDTVSRIHSWAEIVGIVLLGLLVIAEAVTFKYSARKDTLTEQQQSADKRQHDEEIARLHLQTAELTADAEKSRAAIAEATARAAEANRIAEGERLARAKLEGKLANRRLNDEQIKSLSVEIQKLNLQIKTIKVTRLGDDEAYEYATSIIVSINRSGIYAAVSDIGTTAPPQYGLRATPELRAAFENAGIHVDATVAGVEGLTSFPEIFVGLKRTPF